MSAAFAAGFFTGSFFPLGDDGTVTTDPDTAVAEPAPAPDGGAAGPIGEPVPATPNTTGPAAAPTAPLNFLPYALGDYGTGPCAPTDGAAEPVLDFADAPSLCIDVTASHTAVFDTSQGMVRVMLDAQNTPGTVNNFVNLARFGYYDGTLIHRSDPSIGILQGGSPHTNDASDPGPGYLIWDEGSGFTYRPGRLAMARTSGPNSADAQFFFTVTDSAALLDGQGTFVVFGEVIEGLDVLVDILDSHLAEPGNDFGGAPDPPVIINSITIETQGSTNPPIIPAESAGLFYYPYALGDYGTGPCAPTDIAEPVLDFADAPSLCIDVTASHTAVFDTSQGMVRVMLDAQNTPGTVNSFMNLARFGYYDGTLIHRSDPSIGILQGGSPHTNDASDPGPGYQVRDEGAGFSYVPGQLAMARTSGPNSADAQFFFTVTDSAALLDGQGTFVVFGEVIEGLDVLVDILDSHLAEPGNDFGGAPDPPVIINSITIETQGSTNPPIIPAESAGLFYLPYALGDYGTGPCAPTDIAEPVLDFADAPSLCIDVTASHTAVFDTSQGMVRVMLDAQNTPGTVNSFMNLARFGYYDGTLIHRSDPSIGILQGGSPHTNDASDPGPGYQVRDEGAGFSYVPGQLAMARTSGPNSADAQFFFTVTDSAALLDGQGTFVVFGEVIEGLDVLVDILDSHLAEPGNDFGGAPDPPVIINSITIETQGSTNPPIIPAESAGLFYLPYALGDYGTGPCAPTDIAEPVLDFADAPSLCIDVTASHTAVFDTSQGMVRVMLDAQNTPGTVNSFMNLARFGYYDGTLIHRSDPSIGILQGGSPHTNDASDPGPGYQVRDEGAGFSYVPGQLAMARTSGPNSADAQFFFTVTDSAALLDGQGTFVVFGEVIEGLDVLVDILDSHLAEPGNDFGGAPDPPVIINSITIETQGSTNPPIIPAESAGLFYLPYALGDYGTGPCAPTDIAEPVLDFADAPSLCIDVTASHTAVFDTSQGMVRVMLDAQNTPGTVNSFVNLARFGYYDGTLIHRSDPSIGILQGGSPHTNDASDPGPGYQVRDEGAGFSYVPGQLAMARTSGPNSADAQFFFTVTDSAALLDGQGTFVVFGEVIEGLDVLVDILDSHLAEPGNDFGGAPDPPVIINSITIETQDSTPTPGIPF